MTSRPVHKLAVTALAVVASVAAGQSATPPQRPKPLWLVITRPMFRQALAPLVAHRRAEGLDVAVSVKPPGQALAAAARRPAYVLLVGDDLEGEADVAWHVPAVRRPLYRWRRAQRARFASDAVWGDRNGDLIPDLPVGRIPARTPGDVKRVVARHDQR